MLRKKANLVLLALVVPVMALTGCGKKGDIITVNGENISKEEFYARLERVPVQTQQGTKLAGQMVVEQMIGEKLIQQLAKKSGVTPTEAQIDSKIKLITKESGGNMAGLLAAQGMTKEDLKKKLSAEQSLINLVSKGQSVTDAEVKSAYDQTLAAKPSPFKRPAQVKISAIVTVKKDKIDKAYKMLSDGTDFGVVAMQLSETPTAKQDKGSLNWLAKEDANIPQAVRTAAFSLAIGKYSKPFQATGTWVIVKADQKRPEKITTFDEVKDLIKEKIAMSKGSQNAAFRTDLQKFTKDATISVNSERYKGIPAMIKKQATSLDLPKAETTSAGTAPTATAP